MPTIGVNYKPLDPLGLYKDQPGLGAVAAAPPVDRTGNPVDTRRPKIENPDGSFSTEETITIEADGQWVNIPTIVGGKRVGEDQAIELFKSGKNPAVGAFPTLPEAESAARGRSEDIGKIREDGRPQGPGSPGEIRKGTDGQDYQYAETTGMAGATGSHGWIRVNVGALRGGGGDPEAKGLARLAPREETPKPGGKPGTLRFVNPGQDKIDPTFRTILEATSSRFGMPLTVTSGYRSPEHPVERSKKAPGEHARGTASDISLAGMNDAQRAELVRDLRARGVKRFGLYSNTPNMLHVDLKDQTGGGDAWFMYDRTNRKLNKAPAWFRSLAVDGEKPGTTKASTAAVTIDDGFAVKDPMGLYSDPSANPFKPQPRPEPQPVAAEAPAPAPEPAAAPAPTAGGDDRYKTIDADSYEQWKADWEARNRSTGVAGDVGRMLTAGNAQLGLAVREAVGMIPGVGPTIVKGLDSVDEWLTGKDPAKRMQEAALKADSSVSAAQGAADAKQWVVEEKQPDGTIKFLPGPAMTDPRSYLRGVVGSAPSTIATMGPTGLLARGAFTAALARGASPTVAAATAARTAMIAGGMSEGVLGGAETSLSVRQRIAALPREVLEQSEAIRTLREGGMSFEDAVATVADDAATQSFIIGGVATAAFGGAGDRLLAKILAEGVGGGVAKRILTGAARGAVAEGVFEELPQSAAQQAAGNLGVQQVDPSQRIGEGVADAAVGGLAAGGIMGGGMGAAGGAAAGQPVPPPAPAPAPAAPPKAPAGPLARALGHGESIAQRAMATVADPAAPPAAPTPVAPPAGAAPAPDGRPAVGATVRVEAEGIEPFMATVDQYADGEVLVFDRSSGEIYQVPLQSISQIAEAPKASPDGGKPAQPVLPKTVTKAMRANLADLGWSKEQIAEMSPIVADTVLRENRHPDTAPIDPNDTAIEPVAPAPAELKVEPPSDKELIPVAKHPRGAPAPGASVFVEGPDGRFAARVERYEGEGADREAVVVDDAGTPMQVPLAALRVSKLTEKEAEAARLKREPPVDRTDAIAGVKHGRRVGKHTVSFPDDVSARIYDLGAERRTSIKLSGKGALDRDSVMPAAQRKLADELGVTPEGMGQIADDYRFRVERSAGNARSDLPTTALPVNPKMLKRFRAERGEKQAGVTELVTLASGRQDLSVDLATFRPTENTAALHIGGKYFVGDLHADALDKAIKTFGADSAEIRAFDEAEDPSEFIGVLRPGGGFFRTKAPQFATGVSGDRGAGVKAAARRAVAVADRVRNTPADATNPVEEINTPDSAAVDVAGAEAATSPQNRLPQPTQGQKEAGNYQKGHVRLGGLDLSIENPAGSTRSGTSRSGKAWSVEMKSHYGYIKRTEGKDGDHVDVFVKPGTDALDDADLVFVVDQRDPSRGKFDEHKVMLGFKSKEEAERAYRENYSKGWTGLGAITETTLGEFKAWLDGGDTAKPFAAHAAADGKKVETTADANPTTADVIHKRMADRVSPKQFIRAAGQKQNEQHAAVVDPQGKLWALRPTTNPAGDHAEFFGELIANDVVGYDRTGYLTVTGYGSEIGIGADGDVSAAQQATVRAMKTAADIEGVTILAGRGIEIGKAAAEQTPARPPSRPVGSISEADEDWSTVEDAVASVVGNVKGDDDKMVDLVRMGLPEKEFLDRVGELLGVGSRGGGGKAGPRWVADTRGASIRVQLFRPDGIAVVELKGARLAQMLKNVFATSMAEFKSAEKASTREARKAESQKVGNAEPAPSAVDKTPAVSDPVAEVAATPATPAWGANNTLVTADRAAEVRKRLREKLRGQINAGIDPEILALGAELAAFHIEAGARRFRDLARAVAADMATTTEALRPFLRAWYNAARDLMEDSGVAIDGMDDADTVRAELQRLKAGTDEAPELDQGRPAALEGQPSEPVRVAERSRNAGRSTSRGGQPDLFGGEPARAGGNDAGRGLAAGQDAVSVPAGRAGERPAAAEPVASDDAGPDRSAAVADASQSIVVPAQERPDAYTITDDDALGEGGAKTKFRQNIAAIEILRTLEQENRPATRPEQASLAKWVGWGGLRTAFYREDGSVAKGWDREAARLKELLTPEEYRAAEASSRNAHYTSPEVVKAIWSIAERLGFAGGLVLEPSVGAGNFIGLMPPDLRKGSGITGVELDRITGGVAKNLYPQANIQAPLGFQDLTVPDGYFDLAIGNPPFGSERLYDADRRELNKFSIHNYFFAKSVDALRPGGVLAMVVTNFFLDAADAKARAYIAARADLLGAIRLPNNAFLKNAGTEVTTDIIVLQKRAEGAPAADVSWVDSATFRDEEGREVALNRWFKRHPDMMLGKFGAYGTMYRGDEAALIAREDDNLEELLAKAITRLPERVMPAPRPLEQVSEEVPDSVETALVGSAFLDAKGALWIRKPDVVGRPQAERLDVSSEKGTDRIAGLVRIRDAFTRLRRAQISDGTTDADLAGLRDDLNQVYDAFVKANGPINGDANKRLFRDDPSWPQVAALETDFDKGITPAMAKKTGEKARTASAKKAAIFRERTQRPYSAPTKATSAKDALVQVLDQFGRVDLGAMSRLYGKTADAIVSELGDLLYKAPDGSYETADAYLTGNVRHKLAAAEKAAETDSSFRRNVEALRAVIPADIPAIDIDVKAGAPWVPANHVADFVAHIAERAGAKAFYSRANAKWLLENIRPEPAAQAKWGTDRSSLELNLVAALNGQTVTIYDKVGDKSEVNQVATEAANEKVQRIKDEWGRWIWTDDARREALARLYNDTFNTDVERVFDGSHLTMPGKVADDVISFRPHQKNFVWRAMQSSTVLADHTVGAGKTFAAIASVMEKRRIGQWRKPLVVVPNHLVGQWAADFVKLYPGARVLAATKKDFEAENRKRFFARMATGDWDAIIVSHSSFGRIGVDPEYEAEFIQRQISDLEASAKELRDATGKDSRSVAQLNAWRANMQAKLQKLLDAGKKDVGLTFNEIGIDGIVVDEAHEFKNLGFATSMTRVAGLGNPQGSQKAADLYIKTRIVMDKTGGRNVMFLTGTPISNTMAEMFTVQRYLDEAALRQMGIQHFDAWAKVFGEVVTDWELSPSGQYKLNSRFARFVNMPELMQRYRSFADVITNDDIQTQLAAIGKRLPIPKVKGGKPENVVVERSPDQALFIGVPTTDANGTDHYPEGSLVWRAENLPKKAEKGADNMLKVMSDARKAALDMRLIDAGYSDYRGSKVHGAADRIKALYDRWAEARGTQLVFIDLSTPKAAKSKEADRIRDLIKRAEEGDDTAQEALDAMSPDDLLALDGAFSVYDDLRSKLIDRGIPAEEIAFIHDANTDAQKEELFGKVRSGRVRLLFGSTAKMGAGTNVQTRLVGLHHLDAPWRPSDLEQREGRIIRQGNELYAADPDGFEVEINRYATKNTLDARMWQTIEAKAKFIAQVRKGTSKDRAIEDIAGEAANAAEMKAAASGNPLILEEMDLRQRVKRLENAAREHDREQHAISDRIRYFERRIAGMEAALPAQEQDAESARAARSVEGVTVTGTVLEKPKEVGTAILAAGRDMIAAGAKEREIGAYGPFKLVLAHAYDKKMALSIEGATEHEVIIEDVDDTDATGLYQRMRNTVAKLMDAPDSARDEIATMRRQIPGLAAQRGDFTRADELAAMRRRHGELLDQLKPKPKPAPAAAQDPAAQASIDGDWPELGGNDITAMSDDDRAEVERIIREVSGLSEVAFRKRIDLPRGSEGWGSTAPTTASGVYSPGADAIAIALNASNPGRVAYHEAFHRLQNLFLTDDEKAILRAEIGRLRRIVAASPGRARQAARMSPREIEAEAFAIYASEQSAIRPHKTLRAAWDRMTAALRRILNYLAGRGFRTAEDIFTAARAGAVVQRMERTANQNGYDAHSLEPEAGSRVASTISDLLKKPTDWTPAALAAVPLNYFSELKRPGMTAIDTYLRLKRQMDTYRGKKHAAMDAVAQDWRKYARLGWGPAGKAGKARAAHLADLMHESTLAGIDPSSTSEEMQKMPGYDLLRARYLEMPESGRQLYKKVRDAYTAQAAELDAILLDNIRKAQAIAQDKAEEQHRREVDRINRSRMSPGEKAMAIADAEKAFAAVRTRSAWSMKARLTRMRTMFEASRVQGPYFPLARFGRYTVTVRDIDGTVLSFSKRETVADRDRLAAQMRRDYPNMSIDVGVMDQNASARDAMDPRLVAEIETILGGAGLDPKALTMTLDQIWQRYLETLPDLSTRKRFIHRKGTAGFDADALRAFASHMFHAAHQMGRLKYGIELAEMVNRAGDQARQSDDPTRGVTLVNELRLRHEWVMNPKGGKFAQSVTSAMFVWYLGATPAAAVVNLTQSVLVGIPVLGSRLGGLTRAGAALTKAAADAIAGRGSITRANLPAEERRAVEAFYESGLIDRTQSHDLAGVGETGVEYSPVRARVMAAISWMFHRAEVANREITALAAYRMARAQGQSEAQAIDTAHDLTWKTHFDYANSSRARILQNDTMKVLATFQNYQLNMWYRIFRDAHQSLKGESWQVRKEARHQLAGMVGMISLLGGIQGVFGYSVLVALAGLFLDDDDDPRKFKEEMAASVREIFGPRLGGMILRGVPGELAGIDLTSRIGMPDLFIRPPDSHAEGRDWYRDMLVGLMGVSGQTVLNIGDGLSLISDGNVARGAEVIAPKAIKDLMQAYRYANEGILNRKGDPIIERDNVKAWDVIAEAMGFTSAHVAERYENNRTLKDAEQRVLDERRELINRFALAAMADDAEGRAKAVSAIKAFNAKPYGKPIPIKADTLRRSLKTRATNSRKRVDGVLIQNERLGHYLRELAAAE